MFSKLSALFQKQARQCRHASLQLFWQTVIIEQPVTEEIILER